MPIRYCALLNCDSFMHTEIVSVFLRNSCVSSTFSFEWNKEILHLTRTKKQRKDSEGGKKMKVDEPGT